MLSFLAASGRPLVAPVWFILEGDDLVFNTYKDTAKGRSLVRDPRISLCVDLEEPPYAFVQIQGDAELRSLRDMWDLGSPRSSAGATACLASWWCG
jgi:PPOX class probable F420-dependent enzyme